MRKTIKSAVIGALALTASATAAFAGSELFPGISAGIPLGVPLPEGVYVISIPTYGERSSKGTEVDVYVDAPAWVIWSTPWTIGGGRVLLDTVTPFVHAHVKDGPSFSGWSNTFLDAQVKWDLGGGFFGGFQAGVYLPSSTDGIGRDWSSFQGIGALSYINSGWNLSATLIYGTGHDENGVVTPDWFNYDLTATKKFGKWEIGAVAYGSTDLGDSTAPKQSQFAAGGLVGYDFGKINVQLKATRDLMEENYGGKETRVWANIIVPLWNPAPSAKDSLK